MNIDIALTFDDYFWAPAYATMRSVILTTKRRKNLLFHLCHDGISVEHRKHIDSLSHEFGVTINYYNVTKANYSKRLGELPPVSWRYSPIVYARLFLTEVLPVDIQRLLFLDADLLVRGPIENLFGIDLDNKVLAAVPDPQRIAFQSNRDIRPRLHFDPADSYFNAGMMLIDFKQWRATDIMGQYLAEIPPAERARFFQDQDILNFVFRDRWLALPPTWNFQDPRVHHETLDFNVLHYTGRHKPWGLFSRRVAFHRIYRHVMTNDVFYRYWRERQARRFRRFFRPLVGR